MYTKSEQKKKQDTFKNWPLIKNPQFLSNPYETSGYDIFKEKSTKSCFGELLSQESFKSRTCDSIEKPWRLKLMF